MLGREPARRRSGKPLLLAGEYALGHDVVDCALKDKLRCAVANLEMKGKLVCIVHQIGVEKRHACLDAARHRETVYTHQEQLGKPHAELVLLSVETERRQGIDVVRSS